MILATFAALALSQTVLSDKQLRDILAPIRAKAGIPALAAAVVYKGKVIAQAAVGVRKLGDATPVAVGDQFHVGSITKSMTALIIAKLIHDKKLSWDSTPFDVFPELESKIDPVFHKVTLRHLLSHRSGLAGNYTPTDNSLLNGQFKDQRAARYRVVAEMLTKPTEAVPGAKFNYSNAGYMLAGAMAEKVAGTQWEELVRRYIFGPLKMTTGGFGPMGTPGKVDQPWQHRLYGAKLVPMENVATMDNPPIIGPAGRVHCSIGDLAKYVSLHMQGEKGLTAFLAADEFKLLHTAQFGGDYAFGWVIMDRPWADHRAIFHNGSNNMNYAVIWMAPSRDFAAVAATNCAGPAAEKAVDDAVSAAIARMPQG